VSDVILACDVGTSSLKLAVFDHRGRVLYLAARGYPTTSLAPACSEQQPADWLAAIAGAVEEIRSAGGLARIAAIAFTGQMSAIVLVDGSGEPLRPAMIWSDTRASAEAAAIEAEFGRRAHFSLVGSPAAATYPSAKARWLKRHEAEHIAGAAKILQPKDFVIAKLTGVMAIDPSDASCTGFLDIERGSWDARLIALARIPADLLPEIVPSATVVGRVTSAGAAWSRLPQGLPVVIGGGDGPSTALGVGAAEKGRIYACLGTSGWISHIADRPSTDAEQRLVTFRHVLPDLFAPTGATQNCGNVLEWLGRTLRAPDDPHQALQRVLDTIEPGAGELLFLPFLHGERTPYWDVGLRGAFIGLGHNHGPDHLLRAAIEGIAFELRLILDVVRDNGVSPASLAIVGGISENASVRKLLAEVLAVPIVPVLNGALATVRGAAILGALALGLMHPASAASWVELGDSIDPPATIDPRLERARRGFAAGAAALRTVRAAMRG
jgi:xylulokinase